MEKRLFFLLMTLLLCASCVFEECHVLTVVGKSNCTFDRDFGTRVCVTKMGRIENRAVKSIRGRTISTKLPEPLEPYLTEVEMCIREGKRVFNKL